MIYKKKFPVFCCVTWLFRCSHFLSMTWPFAVGRRWPKRILPATWMPWIDSCTPCPTRKRHSCLEFHWKSWLVCYNYGDSMRINEILLWFFFFMDIQDIIYVDIYVDVFPFFIGCCLWFSTWAVWNHDTASSAFISSLLEPIGLAGKLRVRVVVYVFNQLDLWRCTGWWVHTNAECAMNQHLYAPILKTVSIA